MKLPTAATIWCDALAVFFFPTVAANENAGNWNPLKKHFCCLNHIPVQFLQHQMDAWFSSFDPAENHQTNSLTPLCWFLKYSSWTKSIFLKMHLSLPQKKMLEVVCNIWGFQSKWQRQSWQIMGWNKLHPSSRANLHSLVCRSIFTLRWSQIVCKESVLYGNEYNPKNWARRESPLGNK